MSVNARHLVEKVFQDNTQFDFLSLEFIAKNTGLDESEVKNILETEENLARRPYKQDDLNLFTRHDKSISVRERISLGFRYFNKQ